MNMINFENKLFVLGLLGALIFMPVVIFAQGNGGSSAGSQDQDRDRDTLNDPQQDRDRDQDCTVGTDCEPIQDRDQTKDQDRIQDPTLSDADGPDRDQLRDQTQDQDCLAGDDCDPIQDQDRDRLQVHTPDQLRDVIQEQQKFMQDSEDGMEEQVSQIYRNQNQVRIAAMALSSSSDLLGPIGPAISKIAQDFDASVEATTRAEEQIMNRSAFARFFFGSDDEEVTNLSNQLVQNQSRVQELNRLMDEWNGDSQIQAMLKEQIKNIEQEQLRLQQFVDEESTHQGLFGFLFGWL